MLLDRYLKLSQSPGVHRFRHKLDARDQVHISKVHFEEIFENGLCAKCLLQWLEPRPPRLHHWAAIPESNLNAACEMQLDLPQEESSPERTPHGSLRWEAFSLL